MSDEKEYHKVIGINMCLDDCVESLRNEFKLSKSQIAKALREKASEINPRKKVVYCLSDGTELSHKEYLAVKKIFGSKASKRLQESSK